MTVSQTYRFNRTNSAVFISLVHSLLSKDVSFLNWFNISQYFQFRILKNNGMSHFPIFQVLCNFRYVNSPPCWQFPVPFLGKPRELTPKNLMITHEVFWKNGRDSPEFLHVCVNNPSLTTVLPGKPIIGFRRQRDCWDKQTPTRLKYLYLSTFRWQK